MFVLISEHLDIDARFVTSETHFYNLGADFSTASS